MIYTAKYKKVTMMLFIVLLVISFSLSSPPFLIIYQITLILLIVVLMCIKFTVEINKHNIIYQIDFLAFKYKKNIEPIDIKYIKLTTHNFSHKDAIIKTNYKFIKFIRIINFMPDKIVDDLINFAKLNNIPLIKTKKYNQLFD